MKLSMGTNRNRGRGSAVEFITKLQVLAQYNGSGQGAPVPPSIGGTTVLPPSFYLTSQASTDQEAIFIDNWFRPPGINSQLPIGGGGALNPRVYSAMNYRLCDLIMINPELGDKWLHYSKYKLNWMRIHMVRKRPSAADATVLYPFNESGHFHLVPASAIAMRFFEKNPPWANVLDVNAIARLPGYKRFGSNGFNFKLMAGEFSYKMMSNSPPNLGSDDFLGVFSNAAVQIRKSTWKPIFWAQQQRFAPTYTDNATLTELMANQSPAVLDVHMAPGCFIFMSGFQNSSFYEMNLYWSCSLWGDEQYGYDLNLPSYLQTGTQYNPYVPGVPDVSKPISQEEFLAKAHKAEGTVHDQTAHKLLFALPSADDSKSPMSELVDAADHVFVSDEKKGTSSSSSSSNVVVRPKKVVK